jgi:hypothetical protein
VKNLTFGFCALFSQILGSAILQGKVEQIGGGFTRWVGGSFALAVGIAALLVLILSWVGLPKKETVVK